MARFTRGQIARKACAQKLGVKDSWDFAFELMKRAHVAVTPGRDFRHGPDTQLHPFSTANSMAQLQEAIAA
jgi:aspartate/methionine/tyrosine aminotransferase